MITLFVKYVDFVDVFDKHNANKLFDHDKTDHAIKVKKINNFYLNLFTICS